MATNVTLLSLDRKARRVGTVKFPAYNAPTAAVQTVDLDSLDWRSRHELQVLISTGVVVGASAANSVKVAYIAPEAGESGKSGRARIGKTLIAALTQYTFDTTQTVTAWGRNHRRDMMLLLKAGALLPSHGTNVSTLYNISSKKVRFGKTFIAPKRLAGSYRAVDTITLTNLVTSASFKLTYNGSEGSTSFVVGTNCTAAAIQTALRTATGDTGLVVTGTTDTGPFTVTYSDGFRPLSALSVTHPSFVQVITLSSFTSTNSFKLTYNSIEGATTFTRGTNATAAAIQSALRTATSDSGLLVSGTTDAGPFTLAFAQGFTPLTNVTVTSGTGGTTGVTTAPNVSGSVTETGGGATGSAAYQIADLTALTAAQRWDLQQALTSGLVVAT